MKPSLFLHLGMSKTATTWFQREVFPQYPGIEFRDQPHGDEILEGGTMQGVLARAFRRSPLIWQFEGESLFQHILGTAAGRWASPDSVLISDQSAGPRLFEYGGYGGPHWEQERMDPTVLGAHLRYMSEEAQQRGFSAIRAMLVFRRQDQWLASKYAQRSDRIVGASQEQFEERIDYYLDRKRGYYSDGIVLDYCNLYREICEAIGRQNTLFLPYELLKTEPVTFLNRVSDFITPDDQSAKDRVARLGPQATSTKTNVRSQGANEWSLRTSNAKTPLLTSGLTVAQKLFGRPTRSLSIQMTAELNRKILGIYRESNARLNDAIEFDLGALGYF